MIVFRIENEDGVGPYQKHSGKILFERMCEEHSDKNHPNYRDDFDNYYYPFVFGFHSRQLYKTWFGGFITLMRTHGFKLSKYEIDPLKIIIGKSGKQIIFRKSDAIKVS
jgi:hypothetical protein